MKKLLAGWASPALAVLMLAVGAPPSRAESHALPHGEAIMLVLTTQAAAIAGVEADRDMWWHDTKVRGFRVQRPFGPGTIDSTHLFTVEYAVGEKAALCWSVDTRNQTIEARGCP